MSTTYKVLGYKVDIHRKETLSIVDEQWVQYCCPGQRVMFKFHIPLPGAVLGWLF